MPILNIPVEVVFGIDGLDPTETTDNLAGGAENRSAYSGFCECRFADHAPEYH